MTAAADRRGLHTPLCSNKPYQCKTTLRPLQSSHLQSVIKDVIVKLLFTPQSPLLVTVLVIYVACGGPQLPQIAALIVGSLPHGCLYMFYVYSCSSRCC